MPAPSPKAMAKARQRRAWLEAVKARFDRHPNSSLVQLADAAGTSTATMCRLLGHSCQVFSHASGNTYLEQCQSLLALPVEHLAPGYKAPLPPVTQLEIAALRLNAAGEFLAKAKTKLAACQQEYEAAKSDYDLAREKLLSLKGQPT